MHMTVKIVSAAKRFLPVKPCATQILYKQDAPLAEKGCQSLTSKSDAFEVGNTVDLISQSEYWML